MFIVAYKQKIELNEEQILSYLKEIVEKIKTEEDPLELNAYRRLFRKAVPFTLRSYFASYLLKQYFTGKLSSRNPIAARNDRSGKAGRKDKNESRSLRQEDPKQAKQGESRRSEGRTGETKIREPREPREMREPRESRTNPEPRLSAENRVSEPRIVLADDVSTTLFLSIGRNRRVYPRDLIGLIMQNVEIEREHIGEIRVLDNYSFVQVITEDAEKIITSLNEFEYRGRKLAVSYSRKREEDAPAETSSPADDDLSAPPSDSWISETDVSDDEEDPADI
jgi:hypothetical protein